MKIFLLSVGCLLPLCLPAQTPQLTTAPPRAYKLALGVLGTYQAAGLLAEIRFSSRFAGKAVGARSFDYERRGEAGGAAIGLLTYYLPTRHQFIEPLVGVGGIYSWYRWKLSGTSGTINDVNVGGALGTNFRFSNRFRTGANVFVGNGFHADYVGREMVVTRRRLLVLPTLTMEILL